jgi:hypothetical protein
MIAVVTFLANWSVVVWAMTGGFSLFLFVWMIAHLIGWVRRLIEYA